MQVPKKICDAPGEYVLETTDSKEITEENLRNEIDSILRDSILEENETGDVNKSIKIHPRNLQMRRILSGRTSRIATLEVKAKYSVTVQKKELMQQVYRDASNNSLIAQIASASIDFGSFKGRLLINHDYEKGGKVMIVVDEVYSNKS